MPGGDTNIKKLTDKNRWVCANSRAHLDGLNPQKNNAAKIGATTSNWQISGKHLVSTRLQMRGFSATEKVVTLTKQT